MANIINNLNESVNPEVLNKFNSDYILSKYKALMI
jgi:hypothetical protein